MTLQEFDSGRLKDGLATQGAIARPLACECDPALANIHSVAVNGTAVCLDG